ncbi:MAG: hypothetical protein V2A71_07415 [Candidatus Eisenbacteria bacterium]
MLTKFVSLLSLVLAVFLTACLLAGCAANLPCTVAEDQVEQARAKAGAADRELKQAENKASDLQAQVESKQATVDQLKAKKAELESALAE